MSKLSAPLKALIHAPFARPDVTAAPKAIRAVYQSIAKDAAARDVAKPCWLTIATATTMTLNSPASLSTLYDVANTSPSASTEAEALRTAEHMREVGLKCISFNGIPRSINNLGIFRASLPAHISARLTTTPTREPNAQNIAAISARGRALWDDLYRPFEEKLLAKLGESHPDLPVHILHSHYSALLSDPAPTAEGEEEARPRAGRVLTSLIAIACLRAQTGVAPQVVSHVFGLRKAFEAGAVASAETALPGARWLASDEGSVWVLETVDRIVRAFGEPSGSTFAPGVGAKL
ncbi:uncharacterized protein K452DRAFT_349245 [Aplosporella prunicola CBS 121167]|uniref:Dol-P-Man:Man(5)GlcNAc(2)-PP-Dol alpha-1,3-mannosyltransferase n=1 Tax=Aplosporella prunicola CBS 121167 TaxID=1176127 RepID=A0A6A6BQ33_9PEZI|nr:uncharacterized protein K452DRAFT_349245 [Aplosporella prunicola CBS 121167]KAF2145858.1 hypothetical protein K452DRAFT_349245 [Aplosporella prunicola CBS 121167]